MIAMRIRSLQLKPYTNIKTKKYKEYKQWRKKRVAGCRSLFERNNYSGQGIACFTSLGTKTATSAVCKTTKKKERKGTTMHVSSKGLWTPCTTQDDTLSSMGLFC